MRLPFPLVPTVNFHYYLHQKLLDFKMQDLKSSGAKDTFFAPLKPRQFWRTVFLTHLHISTYLHHTESDCYPWNEWHSITTTTIMTIFSFHHLHHVPLICVSGIQANIPGSVNLNIHLCTPSFPALTQSCNRYLCLAKCRLLIWN